MMLKKILADCRFHITAFVLLFVLMPSINSLAATWQWQSTGASERITINLDENQAPFKAKRDGTHSVFIPINVPTLSLNGSGPGVENLTAQLGVSAGGISLQLQNSAFGYFVRQPSPKQIIIDIFSDPLGARWQADGKLAPAGTKGVTAKEANITPIEAKQPQVQPSTDNLPSNPASPAIAPAASMPPENAQQSSSSPSETQSMPMDNSILPASQPFSMPPEVAPKDNDHDEQSTTQLPLQDANGNLSNEDSVETPTPKQDSSISSPMAADATSDLAQDNEAPPLRLVAAADTNALNDTAGAKPSTLNQSLELSIEPSSGSNQARGRALGAQEVVGGINKGGPESWPEDAGINTSLPTGSSVIQSVNKETITMQDSNVAPSAEGVKPTEQSATVPAQAPNSSPTPQVNPDMASPDTLSSDTPSPDTPSPEGVRQSVNTEGRPEITTPEEEPRPVIYMDEEGNVVEKPPVPEELFAQAEKLIFESKYTEAVPILEQLRAMPNLSREMREQVLYNLSDALFTIYEGKALEGFEPISNATNEAMNVNLRSTRVPDALYRLGLINLGVGNFAEAEGYFKALKRRYSYDINIPAAFYQLGKAQMEKGLYTEAEKNFRMVINEYPDASALDESTTSLVKALVKLKDFQEAQVYADFAAKRWARFYVEDPDYLNYLAEMDYGLGNKEGALARYWLLYNLDPQNERSSTVLAKIGDLYFETGRPKAALETFAEIEARFPDSDAAALAYLRRSEQGIYDSPINMAAMFNVFENPGSPLPQVAYKTLQKKRPDDKRSITSQLKYALWQLWNKEYTDAMGSAADFIDLHPEHPDVELAKDTIMRGFMADLKNSLAEENYGRVLILWNGFPVVRERYGPVDVELRNALGRGFLERGEDEKAMEMLAEFLKTPMNDRYSEPTFALYFNKYLESGNWNAMLDLGELVKDWQMTPVMRGQLDYAMALSAENLGLRDRALVLWKPLSENNNLQLYQRAYATYFLAKDAEERQDIREAYSYNLKTLELFEALREERSDRADADRIKEAISALMDITEVSNRIPEALEWVERYNEFAPEGSPEYPGLRFREARLYRKLGNNERARLLLEIIVNDYADSPFATAASTELSTFEMSRDLQNFLPTQGS